MTTLARGRRDEEQPLPADPVGELRLDAVEELSHPRFGVGGSLPAVSRPCGVRVDRRGVASTAARAYLCAGLGAIVLHFVRGGDDVLVYDVIGIVSAAVILGATAYRRPATWRAWTAIGLSQALMAVGDMIYDNFTSRYPGPADVLYLAGVATLVAGAVMLVTATARRDLLSHLDALLVTVGIGVAAWTLGFDGVGTEGTLVERFVSVAYPARRRAAARRPDPSGVRERPPPAVVLAPARRCDAALRLRRRVGDPVAGADLRRRHELARRRLAALLRPARSRRARAVDGPRRRGCGRARCPASLVAACVRRRSRPHPRAGVRRRRRALASLASTSSSSARPRPSSSRSSSCASSGSCARSSGCARRRSSRSASSGWSSSARRSASRSAVTA